MDRLLTRLERRFGKLAIENLANVLAVGMGFVLVLSIAQPGFVDKLWLYPAAVVHGHQYWRVFTYLFLPPPGSSPIWILINLYFFWMIASNLESEWGAFKFNVYYGIGAAATTVAAFATGMGVGNLYLSGSLALAFATLFPTFEILIFFIIPVQVRWLGWLVAALLAYAAVTGDWPERAAVIAAVVNYLLFFWSEIGSFVRGTAGAPRQARRRESFAPEPPEPKDVRTCALCGAKATDGADIRVCSCDKCKEASGGRSRTLCLEHARNH
jgi:hypothetical protein